MIVTTTFTFLIFQINAVELVTNPDHQYSVGFPEILDKSATSMKIKEGFSSHSLDVEKSSVLKIFFGNNASIQNQR